MIHIIHRPHILALLLQCSGIKEVIHALTSKGADMRFVGGSVRDALLHRPITDIDIATPLLPQASMALLQSHGLKVLPTGLKHGTVTAFCHGNSFEITTLRRDVECLGRQAIVSFTTDWHADAARRDFTINTLSCSPDGMIYDYFGGIADLEQGIVRFVGDPHKRIAEDFLRILRFFRFFAYYGNGTIDPAALSACSSHASSLSILSGERIKSEMFKILSSPDPAAILSLMQHHGVLPSIMPCRIIFSSLEALVPIEQKIHSKPHPLRRLAIMLRSLNETDRLPTTTAISRMWKLSNHEKNTLEQLVSSTISLSTNIHQQKRALRRLGKALFCDLVLLHWAESMAENTLPLQMLALADSWQPPAFPLDGNDLLPLGISGKALGLQLRALEDWWEEGGYSATKEMLLARISHQNNQ